MRTPILAATTTVLLAAGTVGAQSHPYGWRLGQNSNGRIWVDFLWEMTHKKWESRPGEYKGVIDDGLKFEEWQLDTPQLDLFPMEAGAHIALEIISFDPGVILRDPDNPATTYTEPGTIYDIGMTGTAFARRSLWQIDPTQPGFDINTGIWEASFRFVDLNGIYETSETFTYLLEPVEVPSPGVGAVVLFGAGLAVRRRRR